MTSHCTIHSLGATVTLFYRGNTTFRLPESLYDKLEQWAEQEDRPLANLIYTLVKQAVNEREQKRKQFDMAEAND